MIFYFSATGNSKYVAERIADATHDQIVSIPTCIRNGAYHFSPAELEKIGVVSPTYSWGLPVIVKEFLENLSVETKTNPYLFFIATYGTTTGRTGYFANRCLRQHGLSFSAYFSVKMPDTWTPVFDLSDQAKVAKINEAAEPQISFIIDSVARSAAGDYMKNKMPVLAAKLLYGMEYDAMRKTKNLKVSDSCIGCGLCAKNCPAAAIELRNGKPVWIKSECVMCLGCLHRCPKFAIQYGKHTSQHGQYQHGAKR